MPIHQRNTGPNALRRGRISLPHANYFVTVCVLPRLPVLIPVPAVEIVAEAHRMHAESVWRVRCLTVMPDHAHFFFTLGSRLTLSQAMARLKCRTQSHLRSQHADWQDNYYDHRFRPNDSVEATIRYIWLNPYRAGLIGSNEAWPYFFCCAEDWAWFEGLTDAGLPFPVWLQ